jgi:hypothetical protein
MIRYLVALLLLCVLTTCPITAAPFYLTSLTGAGDGTGTIQLNAAQTAGEVNINGLYSGAGSLLPFVLIGGGLVPRDLSSVAAPNFLYTGTIFFTQSCCNGDTILIDDLGSLSGELRLVNLLGSPPPVITPIPEIAPGWATVAGAMLLLLSRKRLHA